MKEIWRPSLGATWLAALGEVYRSGTAVGDGTRELTTVCAAFENADFRADPLLARFASVEYVEEMRKVFFTRQPNRFGHNYSDKLRGPNRATDLSDVIELLRHQPWSKRALVTLAGPGDGTVPCINAIHFLRREEGLTAMYFARGQDMFRKFYADALCIHEMAVQVASSLAVPLILVTGVISSAHVYLEDLAEISELLSEAEQYQQETALHGVLA